MTEEPSAPAAPPWHTLSAEEVLDDLDVSADEGLSDDEVRRRREEHGPNQLRIEPPTPWWRILLDQSKSLVVALLAVAALVAAWMGDPLESAAIGVVLLLNVVIGFTMEWRARQAMEALRRLQVAEATVVRGGKERKIDAKELVPGDVLVLDAGDAIAADARLLETREMRVVEAPLTGESEPVSKSPEALDDEETPLAERTSMIYKGTLAAAGRGRAVVVATGAATEVGRVTELVAGTERERTPLEERLDALGRRLIWLTLTVATVVAGLGVLRGESVGHMVETGVALAVAAVPEGLPVVVTITLALGMRRMARRHALVRRLPAVETLGSATVICTDKTGTLTRGEMAVRTLALPGNVEIEVTGVGYEPEGELLRDGETVAPDDVAGLRLALEIGLLANRSRLEEAEDGGVRAVGDPTEAALVTLAAKAGLDRDGLVARRPEVAEVPFSSERMWMATFHRWDDRGTVRACVKGAPGRIVELSGRALVDGEAQPLDDEARERLLEANRKLAAQGLRMLALAYRDLADDAEPGAAAISDLVFAGFVGMIDPPAEGVRDTVRTLRRAGVRTVMITGDQAITAQAIARELGIVDEDDDRPGRSGRDVARASDEELDRIVGESSVFSRVSPEDKLRLVEALRRRGEIVGMLGDGVNDAPALKRADIGVAMGGRGTDVAKETAALVLQDDRFETIGVAVREGRVLFDNIKKFLFFLFSCNLSEVLVLFIAGLAGWPLPLLPLQILWINLITDVLPALSLAVEPAEPDVMDRPPRSPEASILSRGFLRRVALHGAVLTGASLGAFLWALDVAHLPVERARTVAFMTLALTQIFHLVNARGFGALLLSRRLWSNPWSWGAMAFTLALQMAALYAPGLPRVLEVVPLRASELAVVVAASLVPLVLGQVAQAVRRPGAKTTPQGGAPVPTT